MVDKVEAWKANDGTVFDSQHTAMKYEVSKALESWADENLKFLEPEDRESVVSAILAFHSPFLVDKLTTYKIAVQLENGENERKRITEDIGEAVSAEPV